jgi:GTP-binding protein Era
MPARTKPEARAGRIAIVGRPNVGKSTLMNALVGERIAITSRHPQTTRERIQGVVTDAGAQFVLVDTPGVHRPRTKLGHRMNQQAEEALGASDAILFLTDVTAEVKRKPTREADLAILARLPPGVPVVLVLNKIDRVSNKAELLPLLEDLQKIHDFAAIVPVSASRRDGVTNVLAALRPLLPESPPLFDEGVLSDKPVRFFVAEFVREQILKKTREEVPHGVAVVVDRFDEAPKVPIIELTVIVDKESHKKIVIGQRGSLLKDIGTHARAKVEALLGKQVHMRLWVRVVPRWYESDAKLRDLGYGDDA